MAEHDVAHGAIEHRVAKKFQSLVVDRLTLIVAMPDALVHQRYLVIRNVVRIYAYD